MLAATSAYIELYGDNGPAINTIGHLFAFVIMKIILPVLQNKLFWGFLLCIGFYWLSRQIKKKDYQVIKIRIIGGLSVLLGCAAYYVFFKYGFYGFILLILSIFSISYWIDLEQQHKKIKERQNDRTE